LQDAIERVGMLYSELMSHDEIETLWPFPIQHGFATIDRRSIDRECGWQLYGMTKEHRVPEPNSIGLGVLGVRSVGIDGAVKAQTEQIILRLETVPIASDLLEQTA
jgi:hypothetical protein